MARNARSLATTVPVFAALGDEHRLALVQRLSGGGPASVTELSEGRTITRQAVTKHLRILEQAGLVRGSKRGRESLWTLETARLHRARAALDVISNEWDARLERLRCVVED